MRFTTRRWGRKASSSDGAAQRARRWLLLIAPLWTALAFAQPSLEPVAILSPPYGGFSPRQPVALAVSPTGDLYLLDAGASLVAKLSPAGDLLAKEGGPGSGSLQFTDPADLSVQSGLDLFLADRGNDRIVRLDRDLHFLAEFANSSSGSPDLAFERPFSAQQGARGDLFIADGGNDRILKLDPDGEALFSFGAYGESRGALWQPRRLELDPAGGLWVLDGRFHAVHFDEFGGLIQDIPFPPSSLSSLGLAVSPQAVWVCTDSTLWVYDRTARAIQSYTAAGLHLSDSPSFVDCAWHSDRLWLLDSRGGIALYRTGSGR